MSHDDFAFEPIPGLPGTPPRGETLLWQGRPDTWRLAVEAYGMWWVMGWFAALILWMYWQIAYVPGGQPIGGLEKMFAKVAGLFKRRFGRKPLRDEPVVADADEGVPSAA